MSRTIMNHPFELGQVVITSNASEQLTEVDTMIALARLKIGDWGDCSDDDWQSNNDALLHDERIVSVYHTQKDTKFWIITEHDRSVTTILMPEDY